jgi:hypothetical protein
MDDKKKSALDQFVDIYREVLATTPTDRVTEPSNEQMLVPDEGPTASETSPPPKQTTGSNKGAAKILKRSAQMNKAPALEKDAAKRAPTKKAKKAPKKTVKKAAKKSAAKAIMKKRRGVTKKARRV